MSSAEQNSKQITPKSQLPTGGNVSEASPLFATRKHGPERVDGWLASAEPCKPRELRASPYRASRVVLLEYDRCCLAGVAVPQRIHGTSTATSPRIATAAIATSSREALCQSLATTTFTAARVSGGTRHGPWRGCNCDTGTARCPHISTSLALLSSRDRPVSRYAKGDGGVQAAGACGSLFCERST